MHIIIQNLFPSDIFALAQSAEVLAWLAVLLCTVFTAYILIANWCIYRWTVRCLYGLVLFCAYMYMYLETIWERSAIEQVAGGKFDAQLSLLVVCMCGLGLSFVSVTHNIIAAIVAEKFEKALGEARRLDPSNKGARKIQDIFLPLKNYSSQAFYIARYSYLSRKLLKGMCILGILLTLLSALTFSLITYIY